MSNPLIREWGGNAKRAREQHGLTQVEVAGMAGTSQHNLSRIERGEYLPSYELQEGLARVYGVEVYELFPRTQGEAELAATLSRIGNGCS